MSLIADSLKKALKSKEPLCANRPEFNLIREAKSISKLEKTRNILLFFFLIVVPGTILVYLIHEGAFDKNRRFNIKNLLQGLSVLETLGINEQPQAISSPTSMMPSRKVSKELPEVMTDPQSKEKHYVPVPDKKLESIKASGFSMKNRLESDVAVTQQVISKPTFFPSVIKSSERGVELIKLGKAVKSLKKPKTKPKSGAKTVSVGVIKKPARVAFKPLPRTLNFHLSKKRTEIKPDTGVPLVTVKKNPRVAFKPLPRTPNSALSEIKKEKQHLVLLTPSPQNADVRSSLQVQRVVPRLVQKKILSSKASKNADFYFDRGLFYQESGDNENALLSYHKATELGLDNPEIHNNLGLTLKELKRYDESLDEFMRAIMLNPNHVKAYNNLGVVYYIKGNIKGALSNYQKALEINPDNLETYNNLGVVYKNQNWLDRAKSVYNKAFSLNPKHPGTNYNLGLLYEDMNNLDSAIYFYRRFVEFGSASHPLLVDKVKAHLRNLERLG